MTDPTIHTTVSPAGATIAIRNGYAIRADLKVRGYHFDGSNGGALWIKHVARTDPTAADEAAWLRATGYPQTMSVA